MTPRSDWELELTLTLTLPLTLTQVRLGPRAGQRCQAAEERLHSFLGVEGRVARRAGARARPRQRCRPAAALMLDLLGPQRLPDRVRRRWAGRHRRAAQLVGR
mgnify:CR=1 FL=1